MRQDLTSCAYFSRQPMNDYCTRWSPTIFLAVDCRTCSEFRERCAEHTKNNNPSNPNRFDGWSPETAERYLIDGQTLKAEVEHGK